MKNDRTVHEGPWARKPDRSGPPRRPDEPPVFNAPSVVVWTIGVLVAVFFLLLVLPSGFVRNFELYTGVIPLRFLAGLEGRGGFVGMVGPLFSHMALHANLMHLMFNSVWLLIFGTAVARRLGGGFVSANIFLSFFALSGAAGALFYILLNMKSTVLLVGASGGISGLFGAALRIMLAPRPHFARESRDLAPLTDRNLLIWSALILVLNFVTAFYGAMVSPAANQVAWEAHMGGFLFGLLTFPFFDRAANRR